MWDPVICLSLFEWWWLLYHPCLLLKKNHRLWWDYRHQYPESQIRFYREDTSGKRATNEIAQDVCAYIRTVVADLYDQEAADKVRIQYGGSVKPEGLKALLEQPDIDGALVGGASLVVDSYLAMVAALD